jgi:hypothetical protein
VAQVMATRARDGRCPNTIAGVALQPKQFSAWNAGAGGNRLVRDINPGHPMYEKAAEVFDAVMSGRVVDQTGGATHYYSPSGMQALVRSGSQSNLIPKWLGDEEKRSGGQIKIGGHIFVGRGSGSGDRPAVEGPVTALSLSSDTTGDLNAVPAAEGVAATGVTNSAGVNEVQQMILGWKGLPDDKKATSLADAMRRGLEAGDDTLFRDAGGIAMLQRLGAKPGEVDEVLKSRTRYEAKKQNGFNLDTEKFRDDILKRAEAGESRDTIFKDIEDRFNAGKLDDSHARSLAAAAADKVRQVAGGKGKSQLGNPDMLQEIAGLYQYVQTGGDFKGAAEAGKLIAEKYGANESDVQAIVGKMFNDSMSYQTALRKEADRALLNAQAQDAQKAEVERALSKGIGLDAVTTTTNIKVTDDNGKEKSVNATEYGIMQIKSRWASKFQKEVEAGRMTPEKASEEITRMSMLEMQKHNVVDPQTVSQIRGGMEGNIVDPKTGKVTKQAMESYTFWQTLKQTPGISAGYMARVVSDEATRTKLETAFMFDSGTLNSQEALLRAHEYLSNPNRDPNDKLKQDAVWQSTMQKGIKDKLLEETDSGFFSRFFGTADRNEQERILGQNRAAENYVLKRAELYHMQEPHAHAEVKLKKALQDLQRDAVPVMGNLIIASPGKQLDVQMGIKGFGDNAVNDAVSSYIRKNGPTLWGKLYTGEDSWAATKAVKSGARVANAVLNPVVTAATAWSNEEPSGTTGREPPVHITYNEQMGTITVSLFKDRSMRETVGTPHSFFVKDIGAEYRKEQTTPTTWQKTWNDIFKGTARAVNSLKSDEAEQVPGNFVLGRK